MQPAKNRMLAAPHHALVVVARSGTTATDDSRHHSSSSGGDKTSGSGSRSDTGGGISRRAARGSYSRTYGRHRANQGFYDVANEGGRASMTELTTGVEIFIPDFNTKSLYVIP